MILPSRRQASMHSLVPCVVRELSPANCSTTSRSGKKYIGIGASRMMHPLPAAARIVRPRKGVPVPLVTPQGGGHGVANVETDPVAAQVAAVCPSAVTMHLVVGIKTALLDQAGREAERHRSVVGPLPGQKPKRASANHVGQRLECSRRAKLQRRTDGVTDCKPKQASAKSLMHSRHVSHTTDFRRVPRRNLHPSQCPGNSE